MPQAIKEIPNLIIAKNEDNIPVAFMGINNKKLEMLFVKNNERGKGIGKDLLNYGIKNYDINEAINDAYYTYKPEGKFPVVVLNIETDPTVVDVNIHPTKQDVKISKIKDLKELITSTIKKALYESLLIIKPLEDEKTEENNYEHMQLNNKINDYDIKNIFAKKEEEKIALPEEEVKKPDQYFMDFEEKEIIKNEELKSLKLYPVGLALGTYIIAENEDGIYLLDQHAA